MRECNAFLAAELRASRDARVVVALGRIAHDAVLRALDVPLRDAPFAHGAEHVLPGARTLVDSYHCSRYNTQTRRLTGAMFDAVFARAVALAAGATRRCPSSSRPRS